MSEQQTALTSAQVEDYLQQHPEFFNEHLHLLELMSIPHPSGSAISLISKQLEIYRSKHHELENQLTALIKIARDNDVSFSRMHKLTLALLDSSTLEDMIARLDRVLSEYFLTDFVTIRIIGNKPDSAISYLFIEPDSEEVDPFKKELSSNEPKCGHPTLAEAKVLFGDHVLEVKSCAIVPMNFAGMNGLLAIGSREQGRFHYSMGNLFLTQMSEIIGARMISLLPGK